MYGASGHALVVADLIASTGGVVHAFVDGTAPERDGEAFGGATVRTEAILDGARAAGVMHAAIAVGDNRARLALATRLAALGFALPPLVHSSAVVAAGATLGDATIVCAGAVVAAAARVGHAVLVNTAATVDHECDLADGVHVSPGAHLGGRVFVGHCAWVGIGAAVRDRIRIGAGAVVGAGAAVVADVLPGTVVTGVPARVRPHEPAPSP